MSAAISWTDGSPAEKDTGGEVRGRRRRQMSWKYARQDRGEEVKIEDLPCEVSGN
jgi:hypothetical protein